MDDYKIKMKRQLDEDLIMTEEADNSLNFVKFKDIAPNYKDDRLSTSLLQSIVLLEDALNYRSIFHKLDKTTIIIYRFYYSKFVQLIINLNIFIILMLAFIEKPSSLSQTSDITFPVETVKRFEFPCSFVESIDLVCLGLFGLDAIVKTYLIGKKKIFKSPWLLTYYGVVLVSIIDCCVSMYLGCDSPFRIRRYLRPFFLIQSSSLMKKAIKSLKKTLPEIISVFVLLFLNLYFFALIGLLIFPRYWRIDNTPRNNTNHSLTLQVSYASANETQHFEKNRVFGSLFETLINLVILVTTSNHPDVMEQSFSRNRLSALYFILYLIIGYYCITSLITAVVYNKFKGFFRDSIISSNFRQNLGIRASFWILHSKFKVPESLDYLPKTAVELIIESLSIQKKRKQTLIKNLKEVNYPIQINDDINAYIELNQYEKLFLDNFNGTDESLADFIKPETIFERLSTIEMSANHFESFKFRCRCLLATIFEKRAYLIFNCLLTIVNIACVSIELELLKNPYHKIDVVHRNLSYAILAFSVYYTSENTLKLWSFGWRLYSSSYVLMVDGSISLIFFFLQIIHTVKYGHPYIIHSEQFYFLTDEGFSLWGVSRIFNVLLIFRLINLAPSIQVLYMIINTTIDMIRNLRPIFGIMIFIYYDYALLGMLLFGGKIKTDSFDHLNKNNPDEYCGSFSQLRYWGHNFDDFYSSIIILWDTMVINNWQVLQDAFVDTSGEWARLYFIFWWLICTLVCLNMCVSLILDLYVLKCETEEKQLNGNVNRSITLTSIHQLFKDTIPKPEDSMLNKALFKHIDVDFEKLMTNLDPNEFNEISEIKPVFRI